MMLISFSKAHSQYLDITEKLDIKHTYINGDHIGGGVAVIDLNGDGWLDMVFTGGEIEDKLFINDGDGSFVDQSERLIKPLSSDITSSVVYGDFNNDGCTDLYFSVYNRDRSDFILSNDCAGNFELEEIPCLGNSIGATLFDFNKDGFLDVYSIAYVEEPNVVRDEDGRIIEYEHLCGTNTMLYGNGDFTFDDVTEEKQLGGNGCSLAVTVVPIPERETHGIYIANDFGEFLFPNQFLVQSEEAFLDEAPLYGVDKRMYGMGIAVGDYDNDMDLDLYVSNLGENIFYENEGEQFIEKQTELQVEDTFTPDGRFSTSWGTFFMDVDNDTDLDLFVSNGLVFTPEFIGTSFINPNQLFINDNGGFNQTTEAFGIVKTGPTINRGAAMGDLDNDGDLDIIVSYVNFDPTDDQALSYRVYENIADNSNNYLDVRLEAVTSAKDAFGSQIIVYAGDDSYLGYNYSSGIHCSQNTPYVHFGLNQIETIDSIKVVWPNYNENLYYNIPVNSTILLKENAGVDIFGCSNENSNFYKPDATVSAFCEADLNTSTFEVLEADLKIWTNYNQILLQGDALPLFSTAAIFDVSGRLIHTSRLNADKMQTLDTNLNVTGIYVLQLVGEQHKITDKLFISD
jgi:predicted nucleotidyltransferase